MFSPPPHPLLSSPSPPSPPASAYDYSLSLPVIVTEFTLATLAILAISFCFRHNNNTITNETEAQTQQNQHDIELGILSNVVEYRGRDEHGNQTECVICLEGFEDGDMCRELCTCKHTFHKQCLDKWLAIKWHCPLCRSSVNVVTGSTNQNQHAFDFFFFFFYDETYLLINFLFLFPFLLLFLLFNISQGRKNFPVFLSDVNIILQVFYLFIYFFKT